MKNENPAAFNPLDVIDVNRTTLREDIGLVVDALVVPDPHASAHWEESAKTILTGMIAHLCSMKKGTTLPEVRAVLRLGSKELEAFFAAMMENTTPARDLAKAGASMLTRAGKDERGGMMTTIMRNTAWLDSQAVAGALSRADFTIAEVKGKPTTVYAVLPPHLLEDHSRFLRLFVNMTVRAASMGGKARVPVLMLLDEFYSLGKLQVMASASGALASYGLRLWPFLQNLTQLKQLYPDNWQTFFANAGTVQMFAVNDLDTAREASDRLGRTAWTGKIDGKEQRFVTQLLETNEIEGLTERDGNLQLILMAGKPPIIAEKLFYYNDPIFEGEWDVDPDFSPHEEDEDDDAAGILEMN